MLDWIDGWAVSLDALVNFQGPDFQGLNFQGLSLQRPGWLLLLMPVLPVHTLLAFRLWRQRRQRYA